MWRSCYEFMLRHPGVGRRALWWFLRKSKLLDTFDDEGYFTVKLLGATGERFAAAEDGGGINSLILAQELYWKSDLPRVCCDKFAVREFVRSRGLADILVPLVPGEEKWDRAEDIPWDRLPRQFVLKCNNGSGLLRIVRDKSAENPADVRRDAASWLRTDCGRRQRERQYVGMRNCLFAEQLLPAGDGLVPCDYKFMCSNGRPLYAWVDVGRFVRHERAIYDIDFRRQEVSIGFPRPAYDLERPVGWSRMVEVSAELSRGFPIVRIDLYDVKGRVYFGEMTFTSDRANAITRPFDFSNRMARLADPICQKPFMV